MRTELARLLLTDCLKMKRSVFYAVIFGIPFLILVVFGCIYAFDPSSPYNFLRYYILVLTILFPALIGIVSYMPFEVERKCCNYKEMLSTGQGRKMQLISKIGLLFLMDSCALVVSILSFYILFQYCFGQYLLAIEGYLYLIFMIITGRFIIILTHVWINLVSGKGASIGVGILGAFTNAILMTGLGNGIWYWFPCSWNVMLSHIFLACTEGAYLTLPEGIRLINIALLCFAVVTGFAMFLLLFWFAKYERNANDTD